MIGSRSSVRAVLASGVALTALSVASGAFAQNATFNIPAGNAAAAIAAYTAQSGIRIDVPPAALNGVQTKAVTGSMDVRAALDALIEGTRLEIIRDDGDVVALSNQSATQVSALNVVATGTSIAGVRAIGSPTTVVRREDMLKTGQSTLRDVLATLPMIQSGGASSDYGEIAPFTRTGVESGGTLTQGVTNQSGGSSVGLNGQGGRATLVLLDGQRLPSSGENGTFVDITQVPMSALAAVEVITDGASAVYGANAIAGVINLQIRRNYQGFNVSLDYAKDNFAPYYGGAVTIGKAWNWLQGGNVLVTYDMHKRPVAFRDANKFVRGDQRSVGGGLNVPAMPFSYTPYISVQACVPVLPTQIAVIAPAFIPIGIPGSQVIPVNACYDTVTQRTINRTAVNYGLPPGLNGATPTVSQLLSGGGPAFKPDYLDETGDAYTQYARGEQTQNLLINVQQKFSDRIDGSLRMSYTRRNALVRNSATNNFDISPSAVGGITNPVVAGRLFPGPAGTCLPNSTAVGANCSAITIQYPLGISRRKSEGALFSNVAAINIQLPFNWTSKFSVNHGYSKERPGNGNASIDERAGLSPAQAVPGQPSIRDYYLTIGRISPYLPVASSPFFDDLLGRGNIVPIGRATGAVQVGASGPLYNLPAGALRASVGAEVIYDSHHKADYQTLVAINGERRLLHPQFSFDGKSISRSTRFYFETYAPVVGEANARPFLRSLTVGVSGNYTKSIRGATSFDPAYRFEYKPVNDLAISGTYSKNFRAPDPAETTTAQDGFYGNVTDNRAFNLSQTELDEFLKLFQLTPTRNGNVVGTLLEIANGTTVAPVGTTNGSTVVLQSGGSNVSGPTKNRELKPESSVNMSLTFDYRPSFIPGLSAKVSYTSLDYKDKIVGLVDPQWFTSLANAKTYAEFITPVRQPTTCDPTDPTTWLQSVRDFLPDGGINIASQQNPTNSRMCDIRFLDGGGYINLTNANQQTIQYDLSYRFSTDLGTFASTLRVNKILNQENEITPGNFTQNTRDGTRDLFDHVGQALSLRGRGDINWQRGNFGVTLTATYQGPYKNDARTTLNNQSRSRCASLGGTFEAIAPGQLGSLLIGESFATGGGTGGSCVLPDFDVPAWTTLDLNFTYRTNADAPYWRRNVRASLAINNFLNRDPPFSPTDTNVLYDSGTSNIRGRIFQFRIEKEF